MTKYNRRSWQNGSYQKYSEGDYLSLSVKNYKQSKLMSILRKIILKRTVCIKNLKIFTFFNNFREQHR